jgi:hypothetical protein
LSIISVVSIEYHFWDGHQEVNMIEGEVEVAELKAEAFEFMERLNTDIDVNLFSKTVVSVVGDEHHPHPVIAGVIHNLFRATTTYIIHNFCISCRVL